MVALSPEAAGCPSGLAPAEDARGGDPSPFVRLDKSGRASLELAVSGAKCAGCIAKIERGLLALPGVADARLNLSTGRLSVAWAPGALHPKSLIETLERLGYGAKPFDPERQRREIDSEGRALLRRLAVAGFASMNIMLFSVPIWAGHGEMDQSARDLFHWISALIAIPAALYGGTPFFRSAFKALKAGHANMDVPISLGIVLTLAISISETLQSGAHAFFDGAVMLVFFLLIGRYLDHALRERARTAARELLALQAVTAARLTPLGDLETVAARDLRPGDRLVLAAGERAPVDGVIEAGLSEIDRSLVTGESAPVPARPGDALHAGVVNLTKPLTLRATAAADASMLAELARLIEAGEQSRARHVRLADHAARAYVPLVHTAALLTLIGWLTIGGADFRESLLNAVAVLIITCPCALGLAVPAVQVVATGRLFKRGIFVKSGDALERLAQVDAAAIDKTGTLTLGRPHLTTEIDADTLRRAAALARLSRHPYSRALVEAAGPGAAAEQAQEVIAAGVEGVVEGRPAKLGKQGFVAPEMTHAPDEGGALWFRWGDDAPRRFAFADALRPDAKDTIAALEARGLPCALLSGDAPPEVARAAAAAGIGHHEGGLSPQQKIERLEALRANGAKVLMIGDGLNDAAALAAAHASASPGTAVDAAQAAADIVFQGERLGAVVEAIDVARQARRRVLENFALAIVYNLIAVPIAVLGLVTPMIAALAMAGSSLVVTLNALRLMGR